jgi:hypothetical protein
MEEPSDTFPLDGTARPAEPPPPHDTWEVLERLLHALTDTSNAAQAVRATVEAAREGLGADAAFWYSKASGKAGAVIGPPWLTPEACGPIARRLLEAVPAGREVYAWKDLGPGGPAGPAAALWACAPKTPGSVIALRFTPGRPFEPADEKAARLAVKMLVGQRAQAQAGTKQLLLGLVHSLTAVIDAKDAYTAGHSERVARIAVLIAKQMGLGGQEGDVYLAGLLHDVGKIGVRDAVLQKPGKLTAEEYDEVKQHPVIGDRIVASIKPFDRLRPAVRHHHERWDGAGYPDKLAGEAIPPLARILAVADACDAMMSPRRYRPGLSPLQIDAIFAQESGRQWDPAAVVAFSVIRDQVYPPIYQKGIGESAFHALDKIVDQLGDASLLKVPVLPSGQPPGR